MSRRLIKVVLLVLLIAGVIGSGVAQKNKGGSDIPMLALFSDRSGDKITGDGLGFYVHQGTSTTVNSLTMSGSDGSYAMVIRASTGRSVNMLIDTPWAPPKQWPPMTKKPVECADPYFLPPTDPAVPVQSAYWFLRTYWRCQYIAHEDETGSWTELIRSTADSDQQILNLKAMLPGETVGVSVEMMRFRVMNSELTPGYDDSLDLYGLTGQQLDPAAPGSAAYLLVTATDWNGDGVMDWILTTIPGKIVIKQYGRADDVLPHGDGFRMSCGFPCEYGSWGLPFEMKIAKQR